MSLALLIRPCISLIAVCYFFIILVICSFPREASLPGISFNLHKKDLVYLMHFVHKWYHFCPEFPVKCTVVCKSMENMDRLRVLRERESKKESDEEEGRGLCCSEVQPSDLLLSCGPACSAT